LLLAILGAQVFAANPPLTEETFRKSMNIAPSMHMAYRDLACKPVSFEGFADAMHAAGAHADVDRSPDVPR